MLQTKRTSTPHLEGIESGLKHANMLGIRIYVVRTESRNELRLVPGAGSMRFPICSDQLFLLNKCSQVYTIHSRSLQPPVCPPALRPVGESSMANEGNEGTTGS